MNNIYMVSNPDIVSKNAKKYFGKDTEIFLSNRKNSKYAIYNPYKNKFIHFGNINYEDFTKHKNLDRRNSYLKRATNLKGNWRNDIYSPNNLAINLLWN